MSGSPFKLIQCTCKISTLNLVHGFTSVIRIRRIFFKERKSHIFLETLVLKFSSLNIYRSYFVTHVLILNHVTEEEGDCFAKPG